MNHIKFFTAIALLLALTFPMGTPVAGARPPKTEKLMEEMMEAASAAGAMKRQLTLTTPEAKKRFEKIQKLRREIKTLNERIDQILVGQYPKYQRLLLEKKKAAEKYNAAKEKDAGKK